MRLETMELDTDFLQQKDIDDMIATHDKIMRESKDVNSDRLYCLLYSYYVMSYLSEAGRIKGEVDVTYDIFDVTRGSGSVSMVWKNNFVFLDVDAFMKALKVASNFEVYPKTDGTMKMTLGFNRLRDR